MLPSGPSTSNLLFESTPIDKAKSAKFKPPPPSPRSRRVRELLADLNQPNANANIATMSTTFDQRYAGIFTPSNTTNDTSPHSTTNTTNANANMMTIVSRGFETATLLESIIPISNIEEIGSNKFMMAYCVNLERLSVQAHMTAGYVAASQSNIVSSNSNSNRSSGSGEISAATPGLGNVLSSLAGSTTSGILNDDNEYIVEAFLENVDKIESLVKTLLAIEFWREHVLFFAGGGNANKRRGDNCNDTITEEEGEEEEVEFEVEGGQRGENHDEDLEEYNDLNDVDGGKENNDNAINAISNPSSSSSSSDINKGLAYRLASNGNALRTAFILHAETTIVSLLNLIFYRGIPAGLLEGSGEDALLSLVDYCARQLIFLGSPEESNPALSRQKNPLPSSQLSTYLQTRSRIDEIQDSIFDSTYQTAVASVALSRYICENVSELGPSLLSRVLEVHDFPLLMVPLVEEPPWTRRRLVETRGGNDATNKNMIWEKMDEHNEWKEVPSTDLLRLTQLEGQPWLALFHLTTSSVCREAYGLDEYRKSQLMRLRRYIHETLMDQLPVLGDVARYLDELSILGVPPSGQGEHRPSSNASSSGLLLQRVDLLRESIVGKRNMQNGEYWEKIAQTQWEEIFSLVTDSTDAELRRIASEVYGGAGLDQLDDGILMNTDLDSSLVGQENEPPQSTVDDWKLALSKPIDKVTLRLEDGDNSNTQVSFDLVPVQNGSAATTKTALGPFRRIKLSISQTDGEGEAIDPRAKATACVQFKSDPSCDNVNEVKLAIDALELPTVEHAASQASYDEVGIELPQNFTSKEWRQLGDLEGKTIVLQLGFKRLSRGIVPAGSTLLRGYTLSQAFLSQPAV